MPRDPCGIGAVDASIVVAGEDADDQAYLNEVFKADR